MGFFSLDGPFHKYGTILFDLIMLNVFWLLLTIFSLGLLAGPASVALYKSVHMSIIHQSGRPAKVFFSTFKNKFKTSFVGSLIFFLIGITTYVSMYLIRSGVMPNWLYTVYFALALYTVLVLPYAIGLAVEGDLKLRQSIKYTVVLAIKHLPTTILLLAALGLSLFILYVQPVTLLIIASPLAAAMSYFISDKILVKYDLSKFE